jgi:YD repeat-containing protein
MTVQMDANGARSVRTLLEGSTDAVVRLANMERTRIGTTDTPMAGDLHSRRDITYNIFGEAEKIRSELSRNTLQTFDKLGRLVQVRHEVDRLNDIANQPKKQTYDAYTYDALGQQIQHVQYAGEAARPTKDASGNPLAPGAITADDQVTRTDYDGLGRVVTVLSAAGFLTGYAEVPPG